MSRRLLAIVAAFGLGLSWTADARAQESAPASFDLVAPASVSFAPASTLFSADQIQRALPPPAYRRAGSSRLLTSLYASTFAMQALDVHSTLSAFRAGAVEGNPLMAGVTGNRAAFMAVKAGVAASTVLAARQLAKRNKVAAVVTLVAINSAYAFVVNHNYKIARGIN
jgi:hypothetical protein